MLLTEKLLLSALRITAIPILKITHSRATSILAKASPSRIRPSSCDAVMAGLLDRSQKSRIRESVSLSKFWQFAAFQANR